MTGAKAGWKSYPRHRRPLVERQKLVAVAAEPVAAEPAVAAAVVGEGLPPPAAAADSAGLADTSSRGCYSLYSEWTPETVPVGWGTGHWCCPLTQEHLTRWETQMAPCGYGWAVTH